MEGDECISSEMTFQGSNRQTPASSGPRSTTELPGLSADFQLHSCAESGSAGGRWDPRTVCCNDSASIAIRFPGHQIDRLTEHGYGRERTGASAGASFGTPGFGQSLTMMFIVREMYLRSAVIPKIEMQAKWSALADYQCEPAMS